MRSSPLLLRDYFTTHLSFSAQPEFEIAKFPSEGLTPDDLNVNVQEEKTEEKPRFRRCQIFISLKGDVQSKFPYDFSIALVGAFEINSEWPEGQVAALFSANAPALLYSAAREALALMTGQGPYPKVVLPSVTFVKSLSERSDIDGQPQSSGQEKMADVNLESANTKKARKRSPRKAGSE